MTSPHDIIRHFFILFLKLNMSSRVVMGLKGSRPFFQRSMAKKILAGDVNRICEICIDDELLHGAMDDEYFDNTRKILVRLRGEKVTANWSLLVTSFQAQIPPSRPRSVYKF